MNKKFVFLLVLCMVFALCTPAFAVVKPGDDFYYLDTAGILSIETEGTIFFCNQKLEEACGAQIVVAALDSIGDEDIYDYAYELFNEWGIGSAEDNNGLLLLLAIEEDNYYALSGAGMDRILSSSVLQEYLDEELEPGFAAKAYEEGVLKFFGAVLARYADYYNLNIDLQDGRNAYRAYAQDNPASADFGGARSGGAALDGPTSVWHGPQDDHRSDGNGFLSTIIWILVVIFILSAIFGRRRGGGVFFVPFHGGHHHHHHARPPRAPMHRHAPPRRPPRSGGISGSSPRSSFGAGRSGFSSRSSGFGGAHGGGGRSFGGGAGRGRR